MEIRREWTQRGDEIMAEILARWPDRDAILADDDDDAYEALGWWDLLHEPGRLAQTYHRADTLVFAPDELRLLTGTRLALLEHAARHAGESLGHVAAHLKRDIGNVQRDADLLVKMGLLRTEKHGRELRLWARGTTLRVDLV